VLYLVKLLAALEEIPAANGDDGANTSKQTSKYFATFVNPNQTFDTPTGPVIARPSEP